jgi:hypothetical protein
MLVSPYLPKGQGYSSFKNQWRFSWEQNNMPKFEMPSPEEMEQVLCNHQKILEQVKNKK